MARITYAGATDRGLARAENEDNWCAVPDQGLFIVSDGMGGHQAGALASKIVVETLPVLLQRSMSDIEDLTDPTAATQVAKTLVELSQQLRVASQRQIGLSGMGATVVLAMVRGASALIAHLGDSRAYLLRDQNLIQLTNDHSLVQLLLDSREIAPEDATNHPARGQVTQYVGMNGEALPQVQRIALCSGDRFLLCSDGLTGMIDEVKVLSTLVNRRTPREMCKQLISLANAAGGKDNITALIVSVSRHSVKDARPR